jgi:imidazolonepropionase-like amidohydrolase
MTCIHAQTIYTGRGVLRNACLNFNGERIASVSSSPKGRVTARYPVITPAFIDAHSHIGMHRSGEPGAEGESNENLDSILALADALDSVQMDDTAFQDAIELGVLYSCVVPGSGNIIGGRSAIIRHYAANASDALIARAGIKAAFGHNPRSTTSWKGTRPNTRMGAFAVLRKRLDEVRTKIEKQDRARGAKKKDVVFSAEETVLREILLGRERLRAHVHKIDDIAALLRLVDEFKLRITVEHACDVHQPAILRELTRRKIPVVFGPVDSFAYKVELKHENWRNMKHLIDTGVTFGLMTDHPVVLSRQLFLQTRWFLRLGYTKTQAIELVTRRNAEILGISKHLGTLEKGKWASFIGWNGDPFSLESHPVAVYGEGKELFSA